jgi:hypothetical protein
MSYKYASQPVEVKSTSSVEYAISYTDNTPCLPLNSRITDVLKWILLHVQVKVLTYDIIWLSLCVNSVYFSVCAPNNLVNIITLCV